jgi:hypothetical protein
MPGVLVAFPLYLIPGTVGQTSVSILGKRGGWHHQGYCQYQSKQNTDDFQIVTSILSFASKRLDHPLSNDFTRSKRFCQ